MSIVKYIINLEDLANEVNVLSKKQILQRRGVMGSKGLLYSTKSKNKVLTWVTEYDLQLTGLKTSFDKLWNMSKKYDNRFTIKVNGKTLMENISVKEFCDYKQLYIWKPIKKGSLVEIVLDNTGLDTNIGFNFEYVKTGKEFKQIKITVRCVNKDLDKSNPNWLIKEYQLFVMPPIRYILKSPEIDGYELADDKEKELVFAFDDFDRIVYINYIPAPKRIVISHLSTIGDVLEVEEDSIRPIDKKTYYANEYFGYELLSDKEQEIDILMESKSPIRVNFYYDPMNIPIKVICLEEGTDKLLQEKIVQLRMNKDKTTIVEAPNINGYKLIGKRGQLINLEEVKEVIFYYKKKDLNEPEEPTDVDHEYDYKVVMRWQSNSSTDVDLHTILKEYDMRKVYFANRLFENEEGKIWLDHDYLVHNSDTSYQNEPEVGTLLGFKEQTWEIHTHIYARAEDLTKDVELYVYKLRDDNNEILINKLIIDHEKLKSAENRKCHVCNIKIETGQVYKIDKYY